MKPFRRTLFEQSSNVPIQSEALNREALGKQSFFALQKRHFAEARAQLSTEALLAVIVVLLLAVVVSAFALQENNEAALLSANAVSKESCEKLSSIIYFVSNSNAKASIVFDLDANAVISASTITVGSYYCDFLGNAQGSGLNAGRLRAFKNSQGVVVFEQA